MPNFAVLLSPHDLIFRFLWLSARRKVRCMVDTLLVAEGLHAISTVRSLETCFSLTRCPNMEIATEEVSNNMTGPKTLRGPQQLRVGDFWFSSKLGRSRWLSSHMLCHFPTYTRELGWVSNTTWTKRSKWKGDEDNWKGKLQLSNLDESPASTNRWLMQKKCRRCGAEARIIS